MDRLTCDIPDAWAGAGGRNRMNRKLPLSTRHLDESLINNDNNSIYIWGETISLFDDRGKIIIGIRVLGRETEFFLDI